MPQHHHVLDTHPSHRELDGRRGAMVARIGRELGGRHHGCHVAHGEDVARPGLGQDAWIDARVGAADDQDLRRLALGRELLEQVVMLAIIAGAEILESLEKPFQRHDVSPTMPSTKRQGEMTQELLYDKRGEIGWITFNRPQARNALTFAMYEGLAEICARVGQTHEVKALVITGAGDKAFAAGTDIAQFQAFKDGEDGIAYERKMDRTLDTIERCKVPTIAAIAGFCTGGGAAIAAVRE